MANFFIFAMLSTSLQLLVGVSGILSLGHAAFFGIGAYAAGLLTQSVHLPFLIALLGGGILGGLAALLMSPIIRLKEAYFAIASFAFGILVAEFFAQAKPLTGGHDGLIMIPVASIGGLNFDTPGRLYFLTLVPLVLQISFFKVLLAGPVGKALSCMRQNEHAAKSVGLDLTTLKVLVIVIGGITAAIAGGLYAHLYGSISPHTFGWQQSVSLLTMVVVGGGAGLFWVVVATFILLFLPEQFRAAAEYSSLINGVILTLFMMLLPRGLSSLTADLVVRWPLFGRAKPAGVSRRAES
jgi:branched-chain amino acid transport system permease protein